MKSSRLIKSLLAALLGAGLLLTACSAGGASSQPSQTDPVTGPFPDYPVTEDFPPVEFEKLTVANSVEWVKIPNITMTSHLPQYIANVYGLLEREDWVQLEEDVEIPIDETRIGLSLQFYSGDDYYSEGDNLFNYPVYYFYNDNTVVERMTDYRLSTPKTTSVRYQLPAGVISRVCGYINGAGLEGIEYATLTEPVMRMMNNGTITAQADGETLDLSAAFAQPENQTAFPKSLGLDFSTQDGLKAWKFVLQPTRPEEEPTFSLDCDWYRFDFYPGLAAITDHHQPDAPVCYYEIPQGADAQALALIGGWAA